MPELSFDDVFDIKEALITAREYELRTISLFNVENLTDDENATFIVENAKKRAARYIELFEKLSRGK